ncbi:hypothetical protein [Rhodoligotrophos defluvii]|uniref:hypothetical protein n=1 Tax=Rhodoligotrophos defluvii TaxID=2561934 RepID=UPI0010C9EF36|nr:hypothetical protein [Rhodoligotrophos defluvii]
MAKARGTHHDGSNVFTVHVAKAKDHDEGPVISFGPVDPDTHFCRTPVPDHLLVPWSADLQIVEKVEVEHLKIGNAALKDIKIEKEFDGFVVKVGRHVLKVSYKYLDVTDHTFTISQGQDGTVDLHLYDEQIWDVVPHKRRP